MLFKSDSVLLKLICFISAPTMYLPNLIPLRIESARVGQDTTSFVIVKFK